MIFHVLNCIEGFQDFQSCDFEGRSRHTGFFVHCSLTLLLFVGKSLYGFRPTLGLEWFPSPFCLFNSSDLIWELHHSHYTEIPVVYPLSIFESWVLSQSVIVRFADSHFLIK